MSLLSRLFGRRPAMSMERVIQEVRVMSLGPDDVVILKTDLALTAQAAGRIRRSWDAAFPGRRAIVLDRSMDVDVLRPADVA